jgi:hypothetical protein
MSRIPAARCCRRRTGGLELVIKNAVLPISRIWRGGGHCQSGGWSELVNGGAVLPILRVGLGCGELVNKRLVLPVLGLQSGGRHVEALELRVPWRFCWSARESQPTFRVDSGESTYGPGRLGRANLRPGSARESQPTLWVGSVPFGADPRGNSVLLYIIWIAAMISSQELNSGKEISLMGGVAAFSTAARR